MESETNQNNQNKKKSFWQKGKFAFLALAMLFVFTLGFWFAQCQLVCPVCPPEDVDFSLFWQTWRTIEERYIDKEQIDMAEMVYGAIEGMLKTLDDPYTVFLRPEDTKRFIEDVKGSFEGVGMEIAIKEEQLQVVAPIEGTPAQRAGLRPGDLILKIDGQPTADMSIEEAVNLIRGPRGTEVVLTVFRVAWPEDRESRITRDIIDIPSLTLEIREDNIAYLKIHHFSEKAPADFRNAALEIINSRADSIILDLRNNPGGYLEVSQNIAGWFVKKGEIVVIEDFGEKEKQREFLADGNARLIDYPVVVLINRGSASASEILAGALRDNRQAVIVGETSFGKGSVQELVRLPGDASLKLTIARWLTPAGDLITQKGLTPDKEIEMTMEDYEEERDPQLDKAIEVINEIR